MHFLIMEIAMREMKSLFCTVTPIVIAVRRGLSEICQAQLSARPYRNPTCEYPESSTINQPA